MFERFTDRSRRVIVWAQEEARLLNHDYIGTEHILLGLVREGEGVGAKVLASLRISLEDVRADVLRIVGEGGSVPTGNIPFTPRAKKVLEFSLREAVQLGHNYIGTEHLLLGVLREGEGVAAHILADRGARLDQVRAKVVELVSEYGRRGRETVPVEGEHGSGILEGERLLVEAAGPRCVRCRSDLAQEIRYRVLDVPPAEGEGEVRKVALAFCRRCGTSYGAVP